MSTESSIPTADDKARFEAAKRELVQALTKKRAVDKQLAQLEVQIYNSEGSYLADTAAHSGGNLIQGFDGYLKNQTTGRRRYEVGEADRMFSNSSLTYQKSLELAGEGDESSATAQEMTAAQAKKLRDREYQRKKRASARGHSVGTMSDEDSISSGRRPSKRARLAMED